MLWIMDAAHNLVGLINDSRKHLRKNYLSKLKYLDNKLVLEMLIPDYKETKSEMPKNYDLSSFIDIEPVSINVSFNHLDKQDIYLIGKLDKVGLYFTYVKSDVLDSCSKLDNSAEKLWGQLYIGKTSNIISYNANKDYLNKN